MLRREGWPVNRKRVHRLYRLQGLQVRMRVRRRKHMRDECLNVNLFVSLEDARRKIEAWRRDYNHVRPHSSLRNLTPSEVAQQGQQPWTNEDSKFSL